MQQDISIYIHWPFCLSKCAYCSFNSYPMPALDEKVWMEAYLRNLQEFGSTLNGKRVRSIYFGGGTPSLMSASIVSRILDKIHVLAQIDSNVEITLEANPTSTQQCRLAQFKDAGINRISLGIQALNDDDLKFLGRTHSSGEGLAAIERIQNLFSNYSFDLIYARPNQTLKSWEVEVKEALKHVKYHLSLYELTIEQGTKLYELQSQNKLSGIVDQDLAQQMHQCAVELLDDCGIKQYEVSNYTKPGFESRHNLAYWNYDDYLGIGPGAHSRIREKGFKVVAIQEELSPQKWLGGKGLRTEYVLTPKQIASEYVLMNLRKANGIAKKDFENKFGRALENFLDLVFVQSLADDGYLKHNSSHILPTKHGMNFIDNLACKIVSD